MRRGQIDPGYRIDPGIPGNPRGSGRRGGDGGVSRFLFPPFRFFSGCFTEDHRGNSRLIHTKWSLGLKGGVVVANPIPEEDALDADEMDDIIRRALAEAEKQGITGKEVTRFPVG